MTIINFGSINIDKVYSVEDFVQPGETITALDFNVFAGGKGLNQSIAAARAGAKVVHAGAIGPDGEFLADALTQSGADTALLARLPGATGHAVIQVSRKGENSIIVTGGTNVQLSTEYIDAVLARFAPGDIVLLQNETSNVEYIIKAAHARGFRVALNPSPITPKLLTYPLELADFLLVNEIEGAEISGCNDDHEAVLDALHAKFPSAAIVLTLGSKGVLYRDAQQQCKERCFPAVTVDTTAAGDTFCGYFLAGVTEGLAPAECLTLASKAAAIAVSRAGASPSIPLRSEVETHVF